MFLGAYYMASHLQINYEGTDICFLKKLKKKNQVTWCILGYSPKHLHTESIHTYLLRLFGRDFTFQGGRTFWSSIHKVQTFDNWNKISLFLL